MIGNMIHIPLHFYNMVCFVLQIFGLPIILNKLWGSFWQRMVMMFGVGIIEGIIILENIYFMIL